MATKIILKESVEKNQTVIDGFPGAGFVGAIAAGYIIDQLKMDCIVYIKSDKIPGIAVIHDSKSCHLVRIYAKDDLVIVMSELIIPPTSYRKSQVLLRNGWGR